MYFDKTAGVRYVLRLQTMKMYCNKLSVHTENSTLFLGIDSCFQFSTRMRLCEHMYLYRVDKLAQS